MVMVMVVGWKKKSKLPKPKQHLCKSPASGTPTVTATLSQSNIWPQGFGLKREVLLEPVLGPKMDRLDTGHLERNTRNFPPHDPSYSYVVLVILVSLSPTPDPDPTNSCSICSMVDIFLEGGGGAVIDDGDGGWLEAEVKTS
jgi:hypothetical protein